MTLEEFEEIKKWRENPFDSCLSVGRGEGFIVIDLLIAEVERLEKENRQISLEISLWHDKKDLYFNGVEKTAARCAEIVGLEEWELKEKYGTYSHAEAIHKEFNL